MLFIHLSVDEHLGCSYFLAMMNYTTVNICAHGFIWTFDFILLWYLPSSGILDHMVTLYLTFWATANLFSIAAVPFYIHTNNVWGSQFPYILPILVFVCLCAYCLPCEYEVVSRSFDLYLSTDQWCWAFLSVCLPFLCFPWRKYIHF